MALTFSIKQTGVPAGAALAGAVAAGAGARVRLADGVRRDRAPSGVVVVAARSRRAARSTPIRAPRRAFSLAGIFAPLKLVLRHAARCVELSLTGFASTPRRRCA